MSYYVKPDGNFNSNIIPDYIRVKQNILDLWFKIQREYQNYVDKRYYNVEYDSNKIFTLIKSLYFTNLYPLIKRNVAKENGKKEKGQEYDHDYGNFVDLMEESKGKTFILTETQLSDVIEFLSDYLYEIGLTKIDIESKAFDEQFSNSYGD